MNTEAIVPKLMWVLAKTQDPTKGEGNDGNTDCRGHYILEHTKGQEEMLIDEKTYRIEKDFLGEKEIPADVYYGIQTITRCRKFSDYRLQSQ